MADAGDLHPNCVIQDRETEKSECGFYLLESGSRGGLPEMSSGPVETEAQEGTLLVNIGVFSFTSSSGSGLVVGVLDEGWRFKENFERFGFGATGGGTVARFIGREYSARLLPRMPVGGATCTLGVLAGYVEKSSSNQGGN